MTVRITSLCAINSGEEIKVTFETVGDGTEQICRESFIISSRQYLVLGLSKGECTTEVYDTVAHLSEVWGAVRRGTALLAYGACSEKALRVKLVSKGFDREVAAEAVEELTSLGLMCPLDDALREAQRQCAKLWGKKRIAAELYAKGYSSDTVAYALDALEKSGIDYAENCRALIKKRYGKPPEDISDKKKMYDALVRYGYTSSQIREALLSFENEA